MRICLFSREYPPDTGWGGIGAYTYQHAHGLKKLGHDVEVVALAKKDVTTPTNLSALETEGIKVHRAVWGPLLEDLSSICLVTPYLHYVLKCSLALWQEFLKAHRAKPFDVIEAPEHLAEGILPALTKVCPLVIRLHTPHSKFVQQGYHNLAASFDLHTVGNFERMAMLEADVLSSPSLDLAQYVSDDFGYNSKRVEIVRNPVDAQVFTPEGPKAVTADEKSIVMFAGRLEGRKGIYHLVSAIPAILKSCPETKFVFVGADTDTAAGGTSVLQELQAQLRSSNSLDAVQFVGVVPLAEMSNYYRSADICVVPSLYDNAPYTVLEAMACGKPIVGSSAGGIPEYIAHGETGLIVPTANPDELGKAISSLLLDPALQAKFGSNARARIMEHFERHLIAQQAVGTYELAIERFQLSKETGLYRKPPELAIEDFVSTLYSCHEALSDLIYEHSWPLNMQRWLQLASRRPKLAFAKISLAFLQIGAGIPLAGSIASKMAKKLDANVQSKENEAKETMRQRLYRSFEISAK